MALILRFTACAAVIAASYLTAPTSQAGERPTLNRTCDPRPDILPTPWFASRCEYRQQYNRPRFWSGWIAHKIAPSSQEAMVWCENVRAGRYEEKDMPAVCKRFNYPKPWEVLQTGSRPDNRLAQTQTKRAPDAPLSVVEAPEIDTEGEFELSNPSDPVPPPAPSPSDR